MNKYNLMHCHTYYSLLDSVTPYSDYINIAKEEGMNFISFTEHGNIYNWIKKKQACDKAGLKYLHGTELYFTYNIEEKERDNYHICLYARNWEGVKELNKLITLANDESRMYYNPRLWYTDLLNASNNIIITTACIGGFIGKRENLNDKISKQLLERVDYLEVQPHDNELQNKVNDKIKLISNTLGIPMILGTDTHSATEIQAKSRDLLNEYKGNKYTDADKWDLTYKDSEYMYKMCEKLKILDAYNNSVTFWEDNSIEEFELDYSFKYPELYEDKKKLFIDMIGKGMSDKGKYEDEEYNIRIKEEFETFQAQGMEAFMIFMAEVMLFCREKGIAYGPGRGSVAGSLIAYVLGITDVDPIIHGTIFSRFCNPERISLAD